MEQVLLQFAVYGHLAVRVSAVRSVPFGDAICKFVERKLTALDHRMHDRPSLGVIESPPVRRHDLKIGSGYRKEFRERNKCRAAKQFQMFRLLAANDNIAAVLDP